MRVEKKRRERYVIEKRKERMSLPVFNKEKMAYCSLASPTNSLS